MANKTKKVAKSKKAPAKKKVVGASAAKRSTRKASPGKTEKKTKKTAKKSKKNIIPQGACNGFGPCCCCG